MLYSSSTFLEILPFSQSPFDQNAAAIRHFSFNLFLLQLFTRLTIPACELADYKLRPENDRKVQQCLCLSYILLLQFNTSNLCLQMSLVISS